MVGRPLTPEIHCAPFHAADFLLRRRLVVGCRAGHVGQG